MFDVHFTANARALGSVQKDALQRLTGNISTVARATNAIYNGATGVFQNVGAFNPIGSTEGESAILTGGLNFDSILVARGSSETRPANVALYPRIHS